jgi:hypothetical protein
MNQETIANGASSSPEDHAEDYRWIKCKRCKGELGIPSDWPQDTVECPQCGTAVQVWIHVHGKVLYRPAQGEASQTQSEATTTAPGPRSPSTELSHQAEIVLMWGILSVALGWTFMVPLTGLRVYNEAFAMARKERVPVPWKATLGLGLALLFGAAQGLAIIFYFCK